MKLLLQLSRVLVGLLFIFSGLIKANDPLGLSYKMQEFFEIWGWHNLNDYTLALSVLMIAFEIIAGVALLVGWHFALFSWLLLLLILFFTFLTAYALFSGKVRECGCFGDCIKLTAMDSFLKDLILTALILVIFINRKKIKPLLKDSWSLVILAATVLFSFGIQFYVLTYLPVVDCLPYKKGNNIAEKMKIPPGSIPDSTVINYVYLREGKEVEFDADHFPADFNDSLYQFVKRYDKVVRQGNAQPPIKDFVIIAPSGQDTTHAILNEPGYMLLLFTKDQSADSRKWSWGADLQQVSREAAARNIPLVVVTSDADDLVMGLKQLNLAEVPVLKGDLVAIKTAARANPTLILLKQGTIMEKWSYAKLGSAREKIAALDLE